MNVTETMNGSEKMTIPNLEGGEESNSLEEFIKHPLQNVWSLWYYKNDKRNNWKENQRVIASFNTVEDFWALFNYVQPASRLQVGCDYSLFKEGIEPMWEDEQNKKGGRWLINIDRSRRNHDLDPYWQETLLCLIGEAFDELSDEICGAVINVRPKGDKIALWTREAKNVESNMTIGRIFKSRLGINQYIEFQAHSDLQIKTGSHTKNQYTV